MNKRLVFSLVLLAGVFLAPWWLVVITIAVGVYIFPFYGEAIIFGTLIDLLYGASTSLGYGILGLVVAVGILVVVPRIKSAVRS